MATRRMFTKTITNSGKFLRMPHDAHSLYFHLGMNADDDGYVEWYTILQMTGHKEQTLQLLAINGFIHIFDDDVLVIIDWTMHNQIRKDRYIPSVYLNTHILATKWQPNDNQIEAQYSIGKDSIGKDSIGKDSIDTMVKMKVEQFEEFWDAYPVKKQKKTAREKYLRLDNKMHDRIIEDVKTRISNDSQWKRGYIPHPTTYINQERWDDELTDINTQLQMTSYKQTNSRSRVVGVIPN